MESFLFQVSSEVLEDEHKPMACPEHGYSEKSKGKCINKFKVFSISSHIKYLHIRANEGLTPLLAFKYFYKILMNIIKEQAQK